MADEDDHPTAAAAASDAADGPTNNHPEPNEEVEADERTYEEAVMEVEERVPFPPPSTGRRLLRLLGGGSGPTSTAADPTNNNTNTTNMGMGCAALTAQEGAELLDYLRAYGRALQADGGRGGGDGGGGGGGGGSGNGEQGEDAVVAAADDDSKGGGNGNSNNSGAEEAEGGDHNGQRDDGLFASLVLATLRAAHRSTADHFHPASSSAEMAMTAMEAGMELDGNRPTSAGGGGSGSGSGNDNNNSMAGGAAIMEIDTPLAVQNLLASGGPPPLTPRLARRLLTDGLLPLAGVSSTGGGGGNNKGEDVVGRLVRRCVVECILPCAVVRRRDAGSGQMGGSMGGSMDGLNSDIGIDVLLPAYLGRLVSMHNHAKMKQKQQRRQKGGDDKEDMDEEDDNREEDQASSNGTSMDAPAILDALCALPKSGWALRPHRAAAVAAALGELTDLCPAALTGCLAPCSSKAEEEDGDDDHNHNDVDRITSLTDALLRSLRTLTTAHPQELDCLPPLVYQLCLLPSKMERGSQSAGHHGHGSMLPGGGRSSFAAAKASSSSSSGGGGGGGGGGAGSSTSRVVSVSDVVTVELRIRILAGIAAVFDGLRDRVDVAARAAAEALAGADPSVAAAASAAAGQQRRALGIDADAVRWAVGTSLSHVGTGLRGDPDLVKAVLRLVKGDIPAPSHDDNDADAPSGMAPFRFLRLTPFRLCLGLTAASALPRTRATALEAVCDLIVEEQTIATKRTQSPWFNAVAGASVLLAEKDPTDDRVTAEFRDGSSLGSLEGSAKRSDKAGRHVFSCIQSVVGFASSKDGIGAELTGLMQSLVNLGFLLVDCVKKDSPTITCVAPSFGVASSVTKKLTREGKCPLDELRHTGSNVSSKANEAAADIGRRILAFLFVTAGSKAHSGTMSSLSSNADVSPLCRSILHTASGKFCGMAPNAVQHSYLLRDLALGSFESLGDIASSAITALATDTAPDILSANFIPTIINYLSNIPGGGMPPAVAIASVVPALNAILHHQCCRRRYRDVEDNVDHCFLLGKKAIFCTDPERRAVAVNILCMLIGIVVVSGNTPGAASANFSMGSGGATLDEIRGYLRRCLTQHQPSVRMEVYSSLVELLPCGEDANGEDSTTPSASMEGNTTPVPIVRRSKASAGNAICDVVADILSSQLERYVTPEEDKADKKARRDRAKKHGSQLSQPLLDSDEEESEDEDEEEDDGSPSDPPIRFELCLQDGKQAVMEQAPTKKAGAKGKNGGGKSKKAQGPTLIEIARNKIAEPLAFLLHSCSEAVVVQAEMSSFDNVSDEDRVSPNDELSKAFASLRKRVAKSKLADYLDAVQKKQAENDDTSAEAKKERTAGLLATCLLVASAAETLMGSDVTDTTGGDPGEITERLFRLRTDAIDKAAAILATPQSKGKKAPAEKKASKGQPTKKKKKKKVGVGEENDHPNLTADDEVSSPKEIKKTALDKARRAVEDQIIQICPASDHRFLAHALRTYGVSAEGATSRSQLTFGDDQTAQTRLTSNIRFRTFLLNKSLHLLEGSGIIVKAGRRFDPAAIAWKHETDDNVLALKSGFIACSMVLGSLAFTEFASHCSKINRTSLAQVDKGSNDIPLTELSLSIVVRSMQRMTDDHPNHQMSKERRAFTLLTTMINRASVDIPSIKKSIQFYTKGKGAPPDGPSVSEESLTLRNRLLALAAPIREFEDDAGRKTKRGGLLAELLSHSMEREAKECVNLIACAGSACSDPSVRMTIGASVLSCWEENDGAWTSPLGLDHRDCIELENPSLVSPTLAVEAAIVLGGHLDGDTRTPSLPSKATASSNVRESRLAALFPIMASGDWPKNHRKSVEEHLGADDCAVGIVKKLSIAMLVRLNISAGFDDVLDAPSERHCKLSIIDTIAAIEPPKGLQHPRELGSIASSIQASIDIALTDADYVTLKVLPHLNDPKAVEQAKEYVAGRLLAVACTVSNISGVSEDCDDTATFMISLLKSTKRVYSIFTKLIQIQMKNDPTKFDSPVQSLLLDELSSTMTPRTMCLLLATTEHTVVGDDGDGDRCKTLTEKQLNSQGKVASEVVYNKERLDSFLSKASKQLKKMGFDDKSDWLDGHITRSETRSFQINSKAIEAAQRRENPQKKEKKRKAKAEGGSKKKGKKKGKKKTKVVDDDGDDDNESMADAASVVDASVVDDDGEEMDDSTVASLDEDVQDEEEEDDDGEGGDETDSDDDE